MSTLKEKLEDLDNQSSGYSICGIFYEPQELYLFAIGEKVYSNPHSALIKFPGGNHDSRSEDRYNYIFSLKEVLKRTPFSEKEQNLIISIEENRAFETTKHERTLVLKFLEETGKYPAEFDNGFLWYEFVKDTQREGKETFLKIFLKVNILLESFEGENEGVINVLREVQKLRPTNFIPLKNAIRYPQYELTMDQIDKLTDSHVKPLPSFFTYIDNKEFCEVSEKRLSWSNRPTSRPNN